MSSEESWCSQSIVWGASLNWYLHKSWTRTLEILVDWICCEKHRISCDQYKLVFKFFPITISTKHFSDYIFYLPRNLLTTLILHNIQSFSSGQNVINTSEIAANPSLLQKCNKTCKSTSIPAVAVSIKYRRREKTVLEKVWPKDRCWSNDKLWLFWPNNLRLPHGMSVTFSLSTVHEL